MDLFGIGSTVNAISNLATGLTNTKSQEKQNKANLAFQREQFEYLKQQNAIQQQREDTAVQRKMNDLRESGLNPLAADATGGASTGATGATTSFTGVEAAQTPMNMLEGLQIEADSLYNLMGAKNGLAQQEAQTDNLQQDLLNKEADRRATEAGILNTMEDTKVKKKTQEQIAQNILESESNIAKNNADIKNTNVQTDTARWNLNKSRWGNIRTTDAPSKYSVNLGNFGVSFDENSGLIRNNPALNAIGRVGGEITNSINNGIDALKNWGKSKYRQMRGKAK